MELRSAQGLCRGTYHDTNFATTPHLTAPIASWRRIYIDAQQKCAKFVHSTLALITVPGLKPLSEALALS